MWDLGLELALSVMLFLLRPKYDNLRSKLMILWNVNIVRRRVLLRKLITLFFSLHFHSKGICLFFPAVIEYLIKSFNCPLTKESI